MADENLAKVLSSSWQWVDAAQDTNLPNYFLQFAVQGQSFFQDAGDWGAWTSGNPILSTVPDPVIDSALMTVVGGTRLATTGTGTGLQWSSEVAWDDFGAGAARPTTTTAALSGGGICAAYTNGMGNPFTGLAMPTYQQNINSGNPDLTNVTSRTIPDVAMVAENFSSYFGLIASSGVIYDPILSCGAGTSYATPMWAGLTALANQTAANLGQGPIGFANPTLYARAAGYAPSATGPFFHDVTSGNNQYPGESTFFTAAKGYDLVTGLGSPVGCNLVPSEPPQSCMTGSSLSAIVDNVNKVVTAYVPNGSWGENTTGISVFAVEGSGSDSTISTGTDVINTCAGNSLTGEVVCTSNGTNVYLINGSATPTTVQSAANASEHFSGGDCQTCNVAVDPIHNTAYLSIGIANGSATAAEIQPLNLSTGNFLSAFPLGQQRSTEDMVVDAIRGFVLSPNEGPFNGAVPGDYQLVDTTNGSVFDFNPSLSTYTSGFFDAAAEDCSTGIALASMEFSNQLFLVDLSQATFSGTTWSAPFTFQTAPEIAFGTASAPTGGPIAIAPNSHLGVTTNEFGGNGIGVFQLPSQSGTGGSAPQLVKYVAATMPSDPNGNAWLNGQDPHNLTAYTSPNNGKQYAIVEDDASQNGTRTFLAIVDMQALLSLPTTSSTSHTVSGSLTSCEGPGVNGTPAVPNCVVRFVP